MPKRSGKANGLIEGEGTVRDGRDGREGHLSPKEAVGMKELGTCR
jgi:hypothetical protein